MEIGLSIKLHKIGNRMFCNGDLLHLHMIGSNKDIPQNIG